MTFAEFLAAQDFPLELSLRVTPGAARTEITALMANGTTWKMRVAAPPERGKANAEIIRFLEKTTGCRVAVVAGDHTRNKRVRLSPA